jgi:hypothetical protein
LIDDKYHRFYYKQNSWRFSGVIDKNKITDFLFSDYYAITTLPTNDFMEVSYGRRDYHNDDFNVNISWYDHALHIDISVIGNEREGDLYAGRFI